MQWQVFDCFDSKLNSLRLFVVTPPIVNLPLLGYVLCSDPYEMLLTSKRNSVRTFYNKSFYKTVNKFDRDFSLYKMFVHIMGSHIVRAWKAQDL